MLIFLFPRFPSILLFSHSFLFVVIFGERKSLLRKQDKQQESGKGSEYSLFSSLAESIFPSAPEVSSEKEKESKTNGAVEIDADGEAVVPRANDLADNDDEDSEIKEVSEHGNSVVQKSHHIDVEDVESTEEDEDSKNSHDSKFREAEGEKEKEEEKSIDPIPDDDDEEEKELRERRARSVAQIQALQKMIDAHRASFVDERGVPTTAEARSKVMLDPRPDAHVIDVKHPAAASAIEKVEPPESAAKIERIVTDEDDESKELDAMDEDDDAKELDALDDDDDASASRKKRKKKKVKKRRVKITEPPSSGEIKHQIDLDLHGEAALPLSDHVGRPGAASTIMEEKRKFARRKEEPPHVKAQIQEAKRKRRAERAKMENKLLNREPFNKKIFELADENPEDVEEQVRAHFHKHFPGGIGARGRFGTSQTDIGNYNNDDGPSSMLQEGEGGGASARTTEAALRAELMKVEEIVKTAQDKAETMQTGYKGLVEALSKVHGHYSQFEEEINFQMKPKLLADIHEVQKSVEETFNMMSRIIYFELSLPHYAGDFPAINAAKGLFESQMQQLERGR